MRGLRRDDRSVSGYRETLDVLGRLQARQGEKDTVAAPRWGRRRDRTREDLAEEPPSAAPPPPPPPASQAQTTIRSTPVDPVRTGRPANAPVTGLGRPLLVADRGPRRRGTFVAVLALVLAAAAAVAYGIVSTRPTHKTGAPARNTERSTTTTTTSTTLPSSYAAVSTAGSSATYAPVTASYSLSVGATTADCWVSVTAADGTTVLAKTFTAGTSTVLQVSGRASIDLGAPTVASVSIGGVPVALPPGIVGPFTVTLVPG